MVDRTDKDRRRREARDIIDKILNGTAEGRVDDAIAENLRQHLAQHPGEPDRALLAHLKDQSQAMGFPLNAAFPEDLDQPGDDRPPPPWGANYR